MQIIYFVFEFLKQFSTLIFNSDFFKLHNYYFLKKDGFMLSIHFPHTCYGKWAFTNYVDMFFVSF